MNLLRDRVDAENYLYYAKMPLLGIERRQEMTAYVEARDNNLYIGQSRVTLQTLIEAWQSGRTPEQLQDSFPTLPLVAIYGAITYYLEHKDESDAFFRETDELDARRQ